MILKAHLNSILAGPLICIERTNPWDSDRGSESRGSQGEPSYTSVTCDVPFDAAACSETFNAYALSASDLPIAETPLITNVNRVEMP